MAAMIAAGIGAAGSIIGGKSASRGAQKAAGMADPFASQRGMYQGILSNLYGGMAGAGGGVAPTASTPIMQAVARSMGSHRGGRITGLASRRRTQDALRQFVSAQDTGEAAPAGTSIMDFITSSPDYQFRLAEGQRALERSASAKGMLSSGNLLRDLVTFGQGQASSAYESEINRIMTMAGATVGSPGVAGQLAGQGAAQRATGIQQAFGAAGYGLSQMAQNWNTGTTANSMIQGQTGYTGGAAGVLSGDEWANW